MPPPKTSVRSSGRHTHLRHQRQPRHTRRRHIYPAHTPRGGRRHRRRGRLLHRRLLRRHTRRLHIAPRPRGRSRHVGIRLYAARGHASPAAPDHRHDQRQLVNNCFALYNKEVPSAGGASFRYTPPLTVGPSPKNTRLQYHVISCAAPHILSSRKNIKGTRIFISRP